MNRKTLLSNIALAEKIYIDGNLEIDKENLLKIVNNPIVIAKYKVFYASYDYDTKILKIGKGEDQMKEGKKEFKTEAKFNSKEEIKKGIKMYNDPKAFNKPRQVKRMGRGK